MTGQAEELSPPSVEHGWPPDGIAGEPAPAEVGAPGGQLTGRRLVTWLVVIAVGAGLLALLYAASVHAFPGDSDGATVALEGQTMSQGHMTLHGWAMSLDSFWTVDALFYLVAVGLGGLSLGLLHFVPAVIAVLVIGVGAYMAAEGSRRAGAVVGPLVVVALLGFPTHTMAFFFLRGPLHVGTALWSMLAFLGVRRGRFGWGFVAAIVLLAAGMLGDLQALALGVVPIFLAGLVAMARSRSWRGGAAAVAAAPASIVLALAVRALVKKVGTFSIAKANPRASAHQVLLNLHTAVTETAQLFGVTSRDFGTGGTPTWLQDVHVAGLVIVVVTGLSAVVALVLGALRGQGTSGGWPPTSMFSAARPALGELAPFKSVPWRRAKVEPPEQWRLDDLLTIACFAPPATYVVLALGNNVQYGRYLTDGVVFSSILAGRLVGRFVTNLSWGGVRRIAGAGAAAVALALAAAFAAGTGYTIAQPAPVQTADQLATFLESHHLDVGLASYWSANITTVASGGRVRVRAVVASDGKLVRYDRQSPASWYAGTRFHFLVYDLQIPWGDVTYQTGVATWGRPTHFYAVGPYRVLVWSKPISVSTRGAT